jgi:putative transposase
MLRRRRIGAAIPEPADQIANRKRRGATGGRPPAFDAQDYKGRNVMERNFNVVKPCRGLATRYDKLAIVYRAAAVLRAVSLWLPLIVRRTLEPLRRDWPGLQPSPTGEESGRHSVD